MLLFRSKEHIDRWCSTRDLTPGGILSLDQAWRLAYAWYKDKLKPDWQRYTLEETEALFTRLGLTDPFWNLR